MKLHQTASAAASKKRKSKEQGGGGGRRLINTDSSKVGQYYTYAKGPWGGWSYHQLSCCYICHCISDIHAPKFDDVINHAGRNSKVSIARRNGATDNASSVVVEAGGAKVVAKAGSPATSKKLAEKKKPAEGRVAKAAAKAAAKAVKAANAKAAKAKAKAKASEPGLKGAVLRRPRGARGRQSAKQAATARQASSSGSVLAVPAIVASGIAGMSGAHSAVSSALAATRAERSLRRGMLRDPKAVAARGAVQAAARGAADADADAPARAALARAARSVRAKAKKAAKEPLFDPTMFALCASEEGADSDDEWNSKGLPKLFCS